MMTPDVGYELIQLPRCESHRNCVLLTRLTRASIRFDSLARSIRSNLPQCFTACPISSSNARCVCRTNSAFACLWPAVITYPIAVTCMPSPTPGRMIMAASSSPVVSNMRLPAKQVLPQVTGVGRAQLLGLRASPVTVRSDSIWSEDAVPFWKQGDGQF